MKDIVAIYARFSADDDAKEDGIARSIANQIKYLSEYAKENNFEIFETYYDYQKTGTNMNRPGLQQMFKDMKKGLFNTILVKDLSRFSRNYKEAGEYLEQIFPSLNIRFISINEKYDSKTGEEETLVFRNWLNTQYSKDIQRKIHHSFKNRVDKKYLVATPIYGYIKDKDKNLIIDEEASKIVKYIFNSYIEGKSILEIARSLESQKIYNASAHKYYNLKMKISPLFLKRIEANPYHWDTTVIKRMLQNYEYCGHAINLTQDSKTSKTTNIIVKNTHPAIISEETFNLIPKGLNQNKKQIIHKQYFPQMIKCAKHKCSLTFRKISNNIGYAYRCDKCRGQENYIKLDTLIDILHLDVNNLIQQIILDKDKVLNYLSKRFNESNDYARLEKELVSKNNEIKKLFESMIQIRITKDEYNNRLTALKEEVNDLSKKIDENKYLKINQEQLVYNYKKFIKNLDIDELFNLDKISMIKKLIKRVYINFDTKPLKFTISYTFDN